MEYFASILISKPSNKLGIMLAFISLCMFNSLFNFLCIFSFNFNVTFKTYNKIIVSSKEQSLKTFQNTESHDVKNYTTICTQDTFLLKSDQFSLLFQICLGEVVGFHKLIGVAVLRLGKTSLKSSSRRSKFLA